MSMVSECVDNLTKVSFELSRKCPRINEHVACPLHYLEKKYDGYLPMKNIFEVCQCLVDNRNYRALVCFHIYNEPTADFRLAYIIHYVKEHIGLLNPIVIKSNGYGITKETVGELVELGVMNFVYTVYDISKYEEAKKIREVVLEAYPNIGFKIQKEHLDTRLKIYDNKVTDNDEWSEEYGGVEFGCTAPKTFLNIAATGEVCLCELDWKYTITFGNVKTDKLDVILKKKIDFYNMLVKDKTVVDVCARCMCLYK